MGVGLRLDIFGAGIIYPFLLIMIRCSGFLIITPILGSRVVPNRLKAGLSFFLAFLVFPLLNIRGILPPQDLITLGIEVFNQLVIGFTMGFGVYLFFHIFQLAGQFIDMRMGFALANVANPNYEGQAPLVGQFKDMLAILLFLAWNGHHYLIRLLYESFYVLPLRQSVSGDFLPVIFRMAGDVFILSFKLALPVLATLFVVDIIFGILARTIPQMHILVIGFPIKILLGIILLMLIIPSFTIFTRNIFSELYGYLEQLLSIWQG